MNETGMLFVRFFGGLLLGVGILVATLSGLCTLIVLGTSIQTSDRLGMVEMAALFGGIPFVTGVALVLVGRAMLRAGSAGNRETGV